MTTAALDQARGDRVYRWSRVSFDLDDRQRAAVDRALEVATETQARGDADTLKAVGEALRADGFDEHLTAEGFLKLEVLAARTGTQIYGDGLRTWGEYRSESEVGSEQSLRSWDLKPLTDDHPPVMVTPDNYTDFARGSCGQDAHLTEPQADGERYVQLTILVGDMGLLAKIRDGKVELSAGYTAVMIDDPGIDPVSGVEYRYRQTQVEDNHLSVVEAGRAGPLARISLDGSAWEILADTGAIMDNPEDDETTEPTDPPAHADVSEEAQGSIRALVSAAHQIGTQLAEGYEPDFVAAAVEQLVAVATAAMITGEISEEMTMALAEALMLEPEVVAGLVTPGAPPEPEAQEPEMTAPAEEDTVELTDGVTVRMTKDNAEKLRVHLAAQATANADAEAQMVAEAKAVTDAADADAKASAILAGTVDGLTASVARFQADADLRDRDALVLDVAAVCPDLGEKWTKAIADGSHNIDMVDMKIAAIVDLDSKAAAAIKLKRGADKERPAFFADYVDSRYQGTIEAADQRRAAMDTNTETVVQNPTHNDVIRLAAYGQQKVN